MILKLKIEDNLSFTFERMLKKMLESKVSQERLSNTFSFRLLNQLGRKYCFADKEAYAIFVDIKQWQHYLAVSLFILIICQRSVLIK